MHLLEPSSSGAGGLYGSPVVLSLWLKMFRAEESTLVLDFFIIIIILGTQGPIFIPFLLLVSPFPDLLQSP